MADEDLEVRAILSADASKFITPFQQATVATQQLHKALKPANNALVAVGAAVGATGFALYKFGKEAFGVAARVSEMNVAMKAVGEATGLGEKAIKDAANAVRSQGIEMSSAQKIALTYAQNNLNLADASKVARVAQDLAVITQKNSTDTAELLNRAIQTGSTILLKSAGITKYASEGYKAYAKALGKGTNELTALERQQATTNLILEEGRKVAGLYEAAMTEPGKVLRSFARLHDDIKVEMGSALLQGFGPVIKATYDLTKAFSESLREGGYFHNALKAVGGALVGMTQPLTDALKQFTRFIKSTKDSELAVDGLKQKIEQFTPIVLAVSTALSAFAGRGLLNLVGLNKLGAMLSPLGAGFAVLVALSPRLRDAFIKMGKALLPLIPAAINVGRAVAEFAGLIVDSVANILDSGLATVIQKALQGIATTLAFVTSALTKFKPLAIFAGVILAKVTLGFMAGKVAASAFGTRLALMKAGFTNLIGAYKFAVAEQMRYNYTLSQGGFAITKFSTMATVGFRMVAVAAKSLIVSLAPMIAIFAAVSIFSKFREAQQKVKDRTNELTQAFKEQIYELKGNSVEIAKFVSNTDTLGNIFSTTGEQGERLSGAINVLGIETGKIAELAKGGQQGLIDFNKEMKTSAGLADGLEVAFDGKVYKGLTDVTKSLTAEQQAFAKGIGAVNEAIKGTNLVDVINNQMAYLVATDKSASTAYMYAIAEAEKNGVLEGGIDTAGEAIEVNNIFKTKYYELAKAAKKAKEEEDAKTDAIKQAVHASKSLQVRLNLLKTANEDGKVSVEAFAKEMFGGQAETIKFAQAVDNMNKQSSELGKSVEGTKGNFDAFTSAGFDLYNQITTNSASLLELGGNSKDVANYMKNTIEQFKKGAKAAEYTDDEVTDLLNSMGLISGLAEITIQIDIDLIEARKDLAGFLTTLNKVGYAAGGEARQGISDMSKVIYELTKGAKSGTDGFKDYNTETKKSGEESKAVTKEKERLRTAIMKIANEALKKATERMEEYKSALDAMKEASRSAIYGAYSFSDALSKADSVAEKANEEFKQLADTQVQYKKSITDSITGALSFNDVLSEQTSASNELASANKKVTDANAEVAKQQAEYNRLLAVANSAVGRKNRREAYEKAAEQANKLAESQQKLSDATADATAEQGKQQTFIARLREQAKLAIDFNNQLVRLAEMGLEKDAFDQIISAGAKTGSLMAKELIDGGSDAIGETNKLFKEIAQVSTASGERLGNTFSKVGKEVGVDFVAALAQQADDVRKFSDKVKELLARGLSPQNIQMVLKAGYEAGSRIADFLMEGGAKTIEEVNGFEVSLRLQGDALADLLGDTFYQAGFDLASQIVEGIKVKIGELEDFLADATIEQMKAYLKKVQAEFDAILVTLPKKPSDVVNAVVANDGKKDPTVATATQFATSLSGTAMSNIAEQTAVTKGLLTQAQADELFARRVTPFAMGGVVKAPTLGMVGEAGPEAIIPLSKMGNLGGQTINVTVNAGFGADGRAIGDVIVNELKKWSRKNGKIPVTTQ
jgi:hypothetical protein